MTKIVITVFLMSSILMFSSGVESCMTSKLLSEPSSILIESPATCDAGYLWFRDKCVKIHENSENEPQLERTKEY